MTELKEKTSGQDLGMECDILVNDRTCTRCDCKEHLIHGVILVCKSCLVTSPMTQHDLNDAKSFLHLQLDIIHEYEIDSEN